TGTDRPGTLSSIACGGIVGRPGPWVGRAGKVDGGTVAASSMANVENAVSSRLEADRRDLLDLSLRNPLLNYRPRARGLEFVGESPAQLFRALVREEKHLAFLPAPDPAALDESPEPPDTPAQLLACQT